VFTRNSSSSRAIPNAKLVQKIKDDPFIPESWGANQKGMQAGDPLGDSDSRIANSTWLVARDNALEYSELLANIGVHKQLCNRLLEPWMWITVVITSTEWDNFFDLRCSPLAQPEIAKIAYMMRDAYKASVPVKRDRHFPFVTEEERKTHCDWDLARMSAARCARVSYLTHDGQHDPDRDMELAERLMKDKHWSPWEHMAAARYEYYWEYDWGVPAYIRNPSTKFVRNLRGWEQWRSVLDWRSLCL